VLWGFFVGIRNKITIILRILFAVGSIEEKVVLVP
jgi:hypothetical protein